MRGDIVPPKRPEQTSRQRPSAVEPTNPTVSDVSRDIPVATLDSIVREQSREQSHDVSGGASKQGRKKPTRLFVIMAGCAALLAALCIGLLAWYAQQLSPVDAASDEKIAVTIEDGSGLSLISKKLKEEELIRNELAFEWYVRQSGKTSSLQSGSYRLGKNESVPAIVNHLTSGNTDTFSITFLPGATLAKHRQVLIDAGYDVDEVDAALNKQYSHPVFEGKPASADLEGYIYGETYNFPASATVEQILLRTFDQFKIVIDDKDLVGKYKSQGFSLFQGITMASIIQREVATAEDAAQVAQVFKKRYDMGMQLGSDVTYQYIADKTGVARSVDLDSPYNTRRYVGLPPGPISSPGVASLMAVGSPAPGDYLYFLSGDDDKTYFANTNEEHEQNIRDHCEKKCQII